MKLLLQSLLASLIMAKIVLGTIFLYQIEFAPLFTETVAIASELKKDPEGKVNSGKKASSGQAVEKETIDLSFIKKKNAELKEKEKYLENRKIQLVALQEEINNKITTLTRLRNEIKAEMAKKKTDEEQKLKHLIKIYSAMKPPKAASLIEKLDIKLAIELLSKMKGDNVGSILSLVDVGKAAKISEGLLKK
jgi:flagellar motility protein MotE (MotC chaperone)